MPRKLANLVGHKYGRLTVIDDSKKILLSGRLTVECRCDCGNLFIARRDRLLKGSTRSCGCIWKEWHKSRTLKPREASFNQILYGYKRHAKRRNLIFNLTTEEFRYLTQQNCYYCGNPPSQSHAGTRQNGTYIYNGIDRLDNSVGYILDNCVPCCGFCNRMKMNKSTKEFLQHIKQIYENINLEDFSDQ